MIYTCTLNPAIDLFVDVDELKPFTVNRTKDEDYQANGKGINVSIVLKRFGLDSTAIGIIAGFTGKFIQDEIEKKGIKTKLFEVNGITRINIFVNADKEFKIINRGPNVPLNTIEKIIEEIKKIPIGSYLFVSGSLPPGVKDETFLRISKICKEKGIKLILDISSPILIDCLTYHPYLIKPNEEELANLFDIKQLTEEAIIYYGKELLNRGAQKVIVSRGEKGSIYFSKNKILKASSIKGKVVNSACAGDTLLATFVGMQLKGFKEETALAYASAAGALTAFSKGIGNFEDIHEFAKMIKIEKM